MRAAKIGGLEMFIPLTHAPGEAQADFGELQPGRAKVPLPEYRSEKAGEFEGK